MLINAAERDIQVLQATLPSIDRAQALALVKSLLEEARQELHGTEEAC